MRVIARKTNPENERRLMAKGISSVMARLYAARGIEDPAEIDYSMSKMAPLRSMLNLELMSDKIAEAIQQRKRITILADYDVDGATSCAILMQAFRQLDQNIDNLIDYIVPNRMVHGYGLTKSIVDEIHLNNRPDIILTVDNGISSFAGVERAAELGIRVFVTDHHLPGNTLPPAECIVNPNQPGCTFPSKFIAGCGVAWYLVQMLSRKHFRQIDAYSLLPYVALGTIADVVRLDKNNRALVHHGINLIRNGVCPPGIQALAEISNKDPRVLTVTDIGFALGPRINAAGRLENMRTGIECLISNDIAHARELARMLDEVNKRRKAINEETLVEALFDLEMEITSDTTQEGKPVAPVIVSFRERWHEGIVGIVAGRLKEKTGRPAFVLTRTNDGNIKGSGRSIPEFHLKHALDIVAQRCPDKIITYGGHAMAAGVTLVPDGIEAFRKEINQVFYEWLPEGLPKQVLITDGSLAIEEMTREVAEQICLGIWGNGFPEPIFEDEFMVTEIQKIGQDGKHAKILLEKEGALAQAVWFEAPNDLKPGTFLKGIYHLNMNTWNGKTSIQMIIDPATKAIHHRHNTSLINKQNLKINRF